jgi:hypothetical protein
MRSLWRMLASQWLGGNGSEALVGHSTVLESLISAEHAQSSPAFSVRQDPGVSHRAMLPASSGRALELEITMEEALRPGMSPHYPP